MRSWSLQVTVGTTLFLIHACALAGSEPKSSAARAGSAPAAGDNAALRAGQEGTAFGNLTVEGEDRVHFEIERPPLEIAIDPAKAPGLDWGDAYDVLDRTVPDAVAPFADRTRDAYPASVGKPWLRTFTQHDVVRFRPRVENVEQWRLLVADSRGQVVASFEGKGKPPAELAWDGRVSGGGFAEPGVTYSFVLEARDRAGNKRNFVGDGFELPPYRVDAPEGPVYAFVGGQAVPPPGVAPAAAPGDELAPLVLEAASGFNQIETIRPVQISVAARSDAQARSLADRVAKLLSPHLLGGASRVRVQSRVAADAAPAGTVEIRALR